MGRGCNPFLFMLVTLIPPVLMFLIGFLIQQTSLGQYLAFGAITYLMTSMSACAYAMTRNR
jgi:hypothetical protein